MNKRREENLHFKLLYININIKNTQTLEKKLSNLSTKSMTSRESNLIYIIYNIECQELIYSRE